MENGKLPPVLLRKMLDKYTGYKREDVLLSGTVGEDCTFIDFGKEILVTSADPVTAAEKGIGKIAFNINMNDIATSGAEGIGLMLTILLPEGTPYSKLEEIMSEIHTEALKHRMQILGGHTEITDSVNRIVVSVCAMGRVKKGREILSTGLNPGDYLYVSKYLGIEGTLIILSDYSDRIRGISEKRKDELIEILENSLSVSEEGVAGEEVRVSSMHDVTEGGILGAVYEVTHGSSLGCEIIYENLPFMEETLTLSDELYLDPLRLISSGSMLISVSPERAGHLEKKFREKNIKLSLIGKCTDGKPWLIKNGEKTEILPPGKDEIYRLL